MDQAKRARKVKYWVVYQINYKQYRESAGNSITRAKDIEGNIRTLRMENRLLKDNRKMRLLFDDYEHKIFSQVTSIIGFDGSAVMIKGKIISVSGEKPKPLYETVLNEMDYPPTHHLDWYGQD